MKARFLALAALVLGLASCQTEPEGLDVNVGGEVDTTVCVSLPEATRANSAEGAFANLNLKNSDLTIRYIFEVYYGNTGVQKQVYYTDENTASFPVRLVPGRDYNFVAWADIVAQPEDAKMGKALPYEDTDVYYETSILTNITVIDSDSDNEWNAMNEARDAYSGFYNTADYTNNEYTGSSSINIRMTRPFAKLRVITTDMVELTNLGITPVSAKVTYSAFSHESFNALNGTYSDATVETTHTFNYADVTSYTDQYGANKVLFTDYFFADDNDIVKFQLDVYEGDVNNQTPTTLIKHNDFTTDISVQRNYLTTIQGNVLTDGNKITVTVENDGAFYEPENVVEYVEVNTPEQFEAALANPNVGGIVMKCDIETEGIKFDAPATRAAVTYNGRNVEIDGNGNTLTYKGAQGGRIIDFTAATNGASLSIKNLTIINNVSWIERAVNYNTNGTLTLENVTIKSAEGCSLNYAINLPSSSDNAKVEIKDCEIYSGATTLNVWGSHSLINVINSHLYLIDNSEKEAYTVIALNNDGTNTADYSIVTVTGGSLKTIGTATNDSLAVLNSTLYGEVNISETTEVVGEIKNEYIAIVYYEGTDNHYIYSDLQDALNKAKEDKTGVRLIRNINDYNVTTTAPYGNWYGIKHDNVVLDGNDYTLDFEKGPKNNKGKYDNYGIMTSGGTIKNVAVTGVFRGIMIMYPTQDIYVDNVTIADPDDYGVCYTINTGEGDGTHSLHVSNSTLNGWTSIGTAVKETYFTKCTFGQGLYSNDVYGRLVKTYVDAVFENCEFCSMCYLDLSAFEGTKVIVKNCTVNGVKITAENWTSLVAPEDTCGEGQISVELKNGTFLTAENVADYIVFE